MIRSTQAVPLSTDKIGDKESAREQLFLGSRCFDRTNEALVQMGLEPVNWCMDDETNVTVHCSVSSPPPSSSCSRDILSTAQTTLQQNRIFDDDNTTNSTSSDITTPGSTTEEKEKQEGKEEEADRGCRGIRETRHVSLHYHQQSLSMERRNTSRERTIDLTNKNRISSFLQRRNDRLEHEDRQIRVLQNLAVRERNANALVSGCESHEEIVTETREAMGVMAKDIERLNDDVKYRDATIFNLNEELARIKREVKEADATKHREIAVLRNTVNELMTKSDSFDNKVARKIVAGTKKARVMANDIEQLKHGMKLKDAVIGNLKEELTKTKKEALEEAKEADATKHRETAVIQNTVNNLMTKHDFLIDKVAGLEEGIVSRDTELRDLQSKQMNARNEQDMFDPLHSQARLLIPSIDRLKRDHSITVAALDSEIDELKMRCEKKAIVSRHNIAELEWLEKIVAEKDKVIKRQKGYPIHTERESTDRVLIDEMARQEKEVDEKLERTNGLFAELQEEFQMCRRDIQVQLPSIDESKID